MAIDTRIFLLLSSMNHLCCVYLHWIQPLYAVFFLSEMADHSLVHSFFTTVYTYTCLCCPSVLHQTCLTKILKLNLAMEGKCWVLYSLLAPNLATL